MLLLNNMLIIIRNNREDKEKKEEEEKEREEWLAVPPEGTNLLCATVVEPPGISIGIARANRVRAKESESSLLVNLEHLFCRSITLEMSMILLGVLLLIIGCKIGRVMCILQTTRNSISHCAFRALLPRRSVDDRKLPSLLDLAAGEGRINSPPPFL
jgi:hypothetical protein